MVSGGEVNTNKCLKKFVFEKEKIESYCNVITKFSPIATRRFACWQDYNHITFHHGSFDTNNSVVTFMYHMYELNLTFEPRYHLYCQFLHHIIYSRRTFSISCWVNDQMIGRGFLSCIFNTHIHTCYPIGIDILWNNSSWWLYWYA